MKAVYVINISKLVNSGIGINSIPHVTLSKQTLLNSLTSKNHTSTKPYTIGFANLSDKLNE